MPTKKQMWNYDGLENESVSQAITFLVDKCKCDNHLYNNSEMITGGIGPSVV